MQFSLDIIVAFMYLKNMLAEIDPLSTNWLRDPWDAILRRRDIRLLGFDLKEGG
jgi:hypothetical protein